MNARATVDERLYALADHLDPAHAARLRALVAADSRGARVLELEGELERAQDLVREMRRQLDPLHRALDSAHEENRELRRRYDVPWGPLSSKPPLRDRVRESQRVPVLPAPPPPPAVFH